MLSRNMIMGLALVFAATSVAQAQVSPGDFNCDGTVDGLDIPLLVDCLLNGNCDPCGVVIETVTVGNPGNVDDIHGDGYGGVDYEYDIGTFEVTAGQYTEFLNAVAGDDTYGLYDESMWTSNAGCKIERTGSSGSYTYSVAHDWADRPVNRVSWGDAARYSNWLHNGRPTGAQDLGSTENGSYYMNGATSHAELMAMTREPDASWVIPSEDEWYKAAYHYNDGVTGNYFDYPTSSDIGPSNVIIEPDPGNSAAFYDGSDPGIPIGSPYYRPEFGVYENSGSPYGTFDQGGNVAEWTEAITGAFTRGVRGGSIYNAVNYLHASDRFGRRPEIDQSGTGFRVAKVAEPNPTGGCCYPDESCVEQPEADCTGVWQGLGTLCGPNPCLQPAACCYPDGSCAELLEADCTGEWQGIGTTCDSNLCPPPGACCYSDGSCSELFEADCTGDWQGAGTTCNPNPCPQPGACCYPDDSCLEQLEVDCTGDWQGGGTACTPNPCDAMVIDSVPVGNPGNAGEWTGASYGGFGPDRISGAVGYTYNIGTYEVTAGEYRDFLNAVAASDPYGLYNMSMDSDSRGCQITRNGSDGSYTYDFSGRPSGAEADWAYRPVNYVSWGDAARFANWTHNGRPTGPQDPTTTEDGSYFLDGATSNAELMAITREPDASWVIPSEDEWYKAAYHYNDGVTGNYWDYPTESDAVPTSEAPPGTDMTSGSANYYGGGYAVGSPYYRNEVGAYDAKPSDSPYGTFDQGGNVAEWTEEMYDSSTRGVRGGTFDFIDDFLQASFRVYATPAEEHDWVGFRVAEVP